MKFSKLLFVASAAAVAIPLNPKRDTASSGRSKSICESVEGTLQLTLSFYKMQISLNTLPSPTAACHGENVMI